MGQRLENGLRVGTDSTPEKKGLRRLFDQHSPALARAAGVLRLGPQREGCVAAAVGHVVAHRLLADESVRQDGNFALDAGGSRVDDEIVWRTSQLRKCA